MKKLLIPIVLIASLALFGGIVYAYSFSQPKPVTAPTVQPQTVYTPPTRAELLKLVNAERAKKGVAPLVDDARLDRSAQMKADDEATNHYFGHENPTTGIHGYEYINQVGIYCRVDSENLGWSTGNYRTAKDTVAWWVNSKPHYEAMVDGSYTLTGFGIAMDGSKVQVVEHFCQQ